MHFTIRKKETMMISLSGCLVTRWLAGGQACLSKLSLATRFHIDTILQCIANQLNPVSG